VDAEDLAERPDRTEDSLWRSQVAAAKVIALAKAQLVPPSTVDTLASTLSPSGTPPVFDLSREQIPDEVLFDLPLTRPGRFAAEAAPTTSAGRFERIEWQSPQPVDPARFRALITAVAPAILRAKGFVQFTDRPDRRYLLQMVGPRATLEPVEAGSAPGCQLVFIGESNQLDRPSMTLQLETLNGQK